MKKSNKNEISKLKKEMKFFEDLLKTVEKTEKLYTDYQLPLVLNPRERIKFEAAAFNLKETALSSIKALDSMIDDLSNEI